MPTRRRIAQNKERAEQMAARYRAGATLQQIGEHYGVSRERVRQIIAWTLGVTRHDGGLALRTRKRREAVAARKERECLALHGMTRSEYRRINNEFRDERGTPADKFRQQRNNARIRGIEWLLTFADWWLIWQESGRWRERGRGHGYCMSRHGDRGAYEIGNVRIIPAPDNNSEFINRFWREVRSGKRAIKKLRQSKFAGMQVGETREFPINNKRRTYASNAAWAYANEHDWKFQTSTTDGVLTVTRIS